ncbi:MAG: hypothetical protein EOO57_09295 [Hymenobacter sp.]|nr:MAG: hypothetical protein EOO57_09295 [Hymenobacter sp.]
MKYLAALLLSLALRPARAQPQFTVRNLSLPKELSFYDNQFSGLYIAKSQLFLMSESRLQDNAEAKLYALKLADLDRKLTDTIFSLPYRQLPIRNLQRLRARMAAAGQSYEGLEAMAIDQDEVYFSVETATPSTNCYLLKGRLGEAAVVLDTTFLLPLPKPLAPDGAHIYNAGFEALALTDKHLLAFFEYNYFPGQNYAYEFDRARLRTDSAPRPVALAKVPFRITDLTPTGGPHFTALNFFFKGEGGDAVYRTPATETENARLITDASGFKSYCRLLEVTRTGNSFSWKPLWEFPDQYKGYNWEGIAAYKNGYFVVNDKYTPSRPYRTTLLYLQKTR